MESPGGLVCAYLLDGKGSGRELSWTEVRGWAPERGTVWIHLDRKSEDAVRWLHDASGLDPLVCEALLAGLDDAFGRPLAYGLDTATSATPGLAAIAVILLVIARVVRPRLPELRPLGAWLGRVVSAADPVPFATASFGALESAATRASAVFGLFEQRAGVWLALVLIVIVLTWTAR